MRLITLLFFLLFTSILFCQERNEIIQQRIEFISEQLETENLDLTNLIEQLNNYFDDPININMTNGVDLEDLGLLTDVQVSDLLLHRKLHGKFISIYELQSLTYWDMETIYLLLPFITVDERLDNLHVSFKEAIKDGNFDLFLRYQPGLNSKSGYDDVPDSVLQGSNQYYYGNADKYYSRFRYSYKNNISLGITAEKDAGEQFFRGAQKQGFDFYSFHAFYRGGKYLKSFAVGDYQIQLGQGLNLWSSYAFGKSSDILTMKRNPIPIKPYTSVDESRFFRGAAVNLGYRNFDLLLFSSFKKIDATGIQDSTLDNLEFVSTINLSGLHRTNSEISKMDNLKEFISGMSLNYRNDFMKIGVQGIYQSYDKPLNLNLKPYNQYYFNGQTLLSLSTDYNFVYKNLNLFGEVSYSINESHQGMAMLHGALLSLDTRLSLGLLYRDYDEDYHTFYNAGFSEGSRTQNENGLYAGVKYKISKSWSINAYTDVFEFPWMKFGVDGPSRGHEFLIQPIFRPSRYFKIYGRFRQQLRQKNTSGLNDVITGLEDVLQRNYRVNISKSIDKYITLKSRVEYVNIQRNSKGNESGILFTQDISLKPKSFPVDITLRYALFDTDSYDTRIYTYENNALYVFSIPAYYYQGSRAYILLRYSFLRSVDLWVRYGFFLYDNRNEIGSGSELIQGNRRSDLTVQLKISL
tara:strand:+ start:496 stop:2568 length:2073 start_codon:yes stop_codon:yes gene_type:complete